MEPSPNRLQEDVMATTLAAALADNTHQWDGPGPWWPIFPLLWLLFVVALFVTFGYFGRRRWGRFQAQTGQRAGEARLAERYAAGEIDEQEYERRLATLQRMGSRDR
jgi:putative membrane protein